MAASIFREMVGGALLLALLGLAPAAHAETPADYGCDRPIRLAYSESGPLFHDGEGIDRDVVDELAKRTGCRFETEIKPRAQVWQDIQDDKLDMTTSALRTDARNQFAYLVPYVGITSVLVVDRTLADGIVTFDDAVENPQIKFGVVDGYIMGPYFDFRLKNARGRVMSYPDQSAVYEALRRGEVRAIISPVFNYEYYFKTPAEREAFMMIYVSPAPPVSENIVFSRRRFHDLQINAWTRVIEQIRLDGTLERICRAKVSAEMTRVLLSY